MHFDFRPLFRITVAELSRKISLFTDPGHQQGVHWRKSEHQGPWCLALAKPHFWKLGYCIWSLFLETSKSITRQREASPLEARLLPMKGVIVHKHHHTGNWTRTKPKFSSALLLPDPGRQWVAALYIMIIISNFWNFREKTCYFRELEKKTFAWVSNITCTAFAIKTPYKDL